MIKMSKEERLQQPIDLFYKHGKLSIHRHYFRENHGNRIVYVIDIDGKKAIFKRHTLAKILLQCLSKLLGLKQYEKMDTRGTN